MKISHNYTSFPQGFTLLLTLTLVFFPLLATGDDTQALKKILTKLCSLNSEGKLASCCASFNVETDFELNDSDFEKCFFYGVGFSEGSILTSLFVMEHQIYIQFYIIFRDFDARGIRTLEKDLFVELTKLEILLRILPTAPI